MGKTFVSPWVGEPGFIGQLPMEIHEDFDYFESSQDLSPAEDEPARFIATAKKVRLVRAK